MNTLTAIILIYFGGYCFSLIIFSGMYAEKIVFQKFHEAIVGSIFWFVVVPVMLIKGVIKVPNILYNIIKRV